MTIKALLKRNSFSLLLINKMKKFQYQFIPYFKLNFKFRLNRHLRALGLNKNSPYTKLKALKNVHKGERCFIVATGPSLTINDLEKLKKEITFSMNSILLAFDQTDWRPTYYGIQYIAFFKKYEKEIKDLTCEGKFFGFPIENNSIQNNKNYIYPLNLLNHNLKDHKYKTKFSRNIFAEVFDGYTITYSLLQIAVYMGFKQIYLVGTDCNYAKDLNHHFINHNLVDPTYPEAERKMIFAFNVAKKFAERHRVKIYNATRGGHLEVFERVNLDEVLEKSR